VTAVGDLAQRFAEAAAAFGALVDGLNDSEWRAASVEDGRPIGTIAHHVALGYAIGHWRVIAAASGYPQPEQRGTATDRNAAHASATSAPDRATTVALLRTGAAAREATVRSVRPSQLDDEITVGTVTGTVRRLLEGLRGHVLEHDTTVRRSLGR
jgi:hypothetical protein